MKENLDDTIKKVVDENEVVEFIKLLCDSEPNIIVNIVDEMYNRLPFGSKVKGDSHVQCLARHYNIEV